jgi:cell division protein FtsI (penicillin-binding protein 3)
MSSADLLTKLSKDKGFVWVKRKVSGDEKRAIEDADIRGVASIKEYRRLYPQEEMAAQMLGYVDIDNQGLEGLERKYNKYLAANQGEAIVVRDSRGKDLPLYKELSQGSDGFDLHLNIDANIQYWCDTYLAEAVEKNRANGGAVLVMDPRDGRVIALANGPHFNPNRPGEGNPAGKRNRVVSDFYEPGSVFKTVTLVMALENLKNYKSRSYDCEMGLYKIPGSMLHDWHKFGMLNFEGVFINSSNIGIAKIVQDIGPQKVNTYVHKFAFGETTGIDLPAETSGYVKPYKLWSKTSPYIVPIGQEVTVNIVQLARMLSAVVNGGHIVKPFIVNKVIDKKGVTIKEYKPDIKAPVISKAASDEARRILRRVVEEGTGKKASVKGMTVGGKTGTAQKVSPTGGYSKKDYYVTFTGFFPVEDPQYVMVVCIDNPRGAFRTGGMVAAPIFGQIADKVADYAHLRKLEDPVVLTPDTPPAAKVSMPQRPAESVKVPVIPVVKPAPAKPVAKKEAAVKVSERVPQKKTAVSVKKKTAAPTAKTTKKTKKTTTPAAKTGSAKAKKP